MKKFFSYFTLALITATSIAFASCGKDDDDKNSPEIENPTDTTPGQITDKDTTAGKDTTTGGDTTEKQPTEVAYSLDDVVGIWHVKLASGQEEYLEITSTNSRIIRFNTASETGDGWICLKFAGTNVTKNVLGFSQNYLTSAYGYVLKNVTKTEIVATPKSQYFEKEDYTVDDVTLTKVDDLPDTFKDPYFIFQASMDYTTW